MTEKPMLTGPVVRWTFSLVGVLLIGGCGHVGVEIGTVIHEDGSFDRTVTYTSGEIGMQDLPVEYELPAGADWEVRTSVDDSDYLYQARGTFRSLETDYARRDGQTPSAWSRNRIAIRVTPEAYEYRETFSDTIRVPELRELGERYVRARTQRAVDELRETLFNQESDAVVAQIRQHVTTSALGYYDQVWHDLEAVESQEDSLRLERLLSRADQILISHLDRWWRTEGRHYPGAEARADIELALKEFYDEEADATRDTAWLAPFQEELLRVGGAYLPSWFDRSFSFRVTLTMPSTITDSNASQVEGNTATWEFDPFAFLLKDYTLVATAKRRAR